MESTNTFVREHYLIEQVLNCLEKMVERCRSEHRLERNPARDAVRFLRGFAERCHFAREQARLLPAMRAMQILPETCLGCSMLERHQEGVAHVEAMESNIEPASAGNPAALQEFTRHAKAYIELLLEYIARQEDCLFPMIAHALSGPCAAKATFAVESVPDEDETEYTYDTYVELADRLAEYFGVPKVGGTL